MTPPAGSAAAPRTAPRTVPDRRPPGPRRVSGPARRPAPATTPPLRRVVDHPLLDRLIRGRAWIGIVAFALIGIVTMEVALLKLNAGIGRSVERSAVLQRANSLLSAQVSALQANNLQQAPAAGSGMVYDPAGDVRFLTAGNGDAAAAVAAMVAPGQSTAQTSATAGQTPATAGQTPATAGQTPAIGSQAATQPATSAGGPPSQADSPPASSSAATGPTTTSVSALPGGGGPAGASAAPASAGSSAAGASASQQSGGGGGVAGGAVAAPGG